MLARLSHQLLWSSAMGRFQSRVFCMWNVSVLFELVACWILRELAYKGVAAVDFDSTVTRTGTLSWTAQYLDMCAGPVLSLVFHSQSCSVFVSCDISTVTVLIRGSRELPCCNLCLHSKRTCIIPSSGVALSLDSHTVAARHPRRFVVFEDTKLRQHLARDGTRKHHGNPGHFVDTTGCTSPKSMRMFLTIVVPEHWNWCSDHHVLEAGEVYMLHCIYEFQRELDQPLTSASPQRDTDEHVTQRTF